MAPPQPSGGEKHGEQQIHVVSGARFYSWQHDDYLLIGDPMQTIELLKEAKVAACLFLSILLG